MSIAEAPENGWLLHSPSMGEYMLVGPNLDALARCASGMIARTREAFSDAPIYCYELGRQMDITLKSTVATLEPIAKPVYPKT